jgi:very-short-patch-repair endonuclease
VPEERTIQEHEEMILRVRLLRRMASPMEARLWERLRNKGCSGFKFRRQVPIGQFIADFICYEARIIVELDGESHTDRAEYDDKRTAWLNGQGFVVVRFTNAEVRDSLEGVLERIRAMCLTRCPLP